MNIPIVYEDEWFLIVDKPAGLLVIPSPNNEKRTLTSILNQDLKDRGLSYRLHPCHRLDRETSGLLIYAKGKSAQKKIMDLFKQKKIKKTYLAFVHGLLNKSQGWIKNQIEGLPALTAYKVISKRKDFTVLSVSPLTGRTNQIRLHFKGIGHPLVGERKFAFRKDFRLKYKRLCLHASALEFVHPFLASAIKVDASLPRDLQEFLKERG